MLRIRTEQDLIEAGTRSNNTIHFPPGVRLKLADVITTSCSLRFMGDATIVHDSKETVSGLMFTGNANIRSINYVDALTFSGIQLRAETGLFSLLRNNVNTLNLLNCDIDCEELGFAELNQFNMVGGRIHCKDMLPLQCRDLSGFMISNVIVDSLRPILDISQVPILRGLMVVNETVFKHQSSGAAIISRLGGNNQSKTRGKMGCLIRPHSLVSNSNIGMRPWNVLKNIDGADIHELPIILPLHLAKSYLV